MCVFNRYINRPLLYIGHWSSPKNPSKSNIVCNALYRNLTTIFRFWLLAGCFAICVFVCAGLLVAGCLRALSSRSAVFVYVFVCVMCYITCAARATLVAYELRGDARDVNDFVIALYS